MSDTKIVDLESWIEKARSDPLKYIERQATEIVLAAIGASPNFGDKIFLKGGVLMGVMYNSPRQTSDLDFSTCINPAKKIVDEMIAEVNAQLPRMATILGSPDVICKVQSVKKKPTEKRFENYDYPALKMKIGYARRGSQLERYVNEGRCPNVIEADISFNEPLVEVEMIKLENQDTCIGVYSIYALIAEKLRALLQQEHRNRERRQDVYDISFLIKNFPLENDELCIVLKELLQKSRSRSIEPNMHSIDSKELYKRAKAQWNTMKIEVGELPSFEECFEEVRCFYKSLPWDHNT